MEFYHYLFIGVGIYCIIRGFMTITTGKISEKEEAKIKEYSAKGAKSYKILSAVSNIVGGIVCILLAIVKMMNLFESTTFLIIFIAIIVLMVAVYFIIEKKCKEAK